LPGGSVPPRFFEGLNQRSWTAGPCGTTHPVSASHHHSSRRQRPPRGAPTLPGRGSPGSAAAALCAGCSFTYALRYSFTGLALHYCKASKYSPAFPIQKMKKQEKCVHGCSLSLTQSSKNELPV